jgi:hypothetical protein
MRTVNLVSYGPWMNPEAVAGVLGETVSKSYELVVVNGGKRFFGVPKCSLSRGERFEVFDSDGGLKKVDVGVATVDLQAYSKSRFNAVVYKNVPQNLYDMLVTQERDSNFFPTSVPSYRRHVIVNFVDSQPWYKGNWEESGTYVFRALPWLTVKASEFMETRVRFLRKDVKPEPKYLKEIRKAARIHGSAFEKAFLDTTFLADRETTLGDASLAKHV